MMKKALFSLLLSLTTPVSFADTVTHKIAAGDRFMISPELWSNPMEDWRAGKGWMFNTHSGGDRNVVSLTSFIDPVKGAFEVSTALQIRSETIKGNGFIGLQLGLQGNMGDFRESAIYGVGMCVGITTKGQLFIGNQTADTPKVKLHREPFQIKVTGTPAGDLVTLKVQLLDQQGATTHTLEHEVHASWVKGMVAVTASSRPTRQLDLTKDRPQTAFGGSSFGRKKQDTEQSRPLNQRRGGDVRVAFKDWTMTGLGVSSHPERNFGPIWWATYTIDQSKTLRLLAQLAPVQQLSIRGRRPAVYLNLGGKDFIGVVEGRSATALFEIPLTNVSKDQPYTLKYLDYEIEGIVRAVPTGDRPIVVVSMSCNDSTGFPHIPLLENVTAQKPDFLTFHGDQMYEGIGGYGHLITQTPDKRAEICYLRKFAMHGWTWRRLLMTTPSITIPDDHDVMHGNIWGEGGKLANIKSNKTFEQQDSGGYKMSPEFVNMVHRTQTGNLPKAKKQPLSKNGITTYHTSFQYGPLDIAVIADRQFKSAPRDLLPEAKINNGWPQNLEWDAKKEAAIEGAQLLGPVQEKFLDQWAGQKLPDSPFKIVISQSPFLAPQTLPKDMHHDKGVPNLPVYKKGDYAPNDEPKADFDTNGWPQDKQKLAVRSLKKAGAIHIVGDQHLGTTGRYGVDDYNDGSWWIATPAIANIWPRRWMPQEKPVDYKEGTPRWLGKFEDGFGNKFELHAVANPYDIAREPSRLYDRAVGYAITRYDLKSGGITLENWPYTSGPQHKGEDAKPYPGWPIKVK